MDFNLRNYPQQKNYFNNPSRPSTGTVQELLKAGIKNHNGGQPQQKNIKKGNSLSRYKKPLQKGKAPKGQFKKYMEECTNVFYDERPELRQIESYRTILIGGFLVWAFLFASYFVVGRIRPHEGYCPKLARCRVFVRCPDYFQLSQSRSECVLSSTALDQIKWFAVSQVEGLQEDYGERECAGLDSIPEMNTDQLLVELGNRQYGTQFMKKAYEFFGNHANQQQFGFYFDGSKVRPTSKRYSLGCKIRMAVFNLDFLLNFIYFLIALGTCTYIWYRWKENRKYPMIYNFLKEQLMASPDGVLNVTHALPELEKHFGVIDEVIWEKVNDVRAAEKKIGFYEDDFLYWKLAV